MILAASCGCHCILCVERFYIQVCCAEIPLHLSLDAMRSSALAHPLTQTPRHDPSLSK